MLWRDGDPLRLERAVNIADLRRMSQRRLPRAVFDLIDGGAGDEVSLRRNVEAFGRVAFRPRPLVDLTSRDMSTTVFGEHLDMPVLLAPTGAPRVAHRRAELEVVDGANRSGVLYVQSSISSYELEAIASASQRPLWYQMTVPRTRDETRRTVARVAAAGCSALVVTIDAAVFGNRERDIRNRATVPARITPRLVLQAASRPAWSADFLRSLLAARMGAGARPVSTTTTQGQIIAAHWPTTWQDLELVRELWTGPLLVKGLMRHDECDELARMGIDGVIVSNHGGRQLDHTLGTLDVLPSIVEAVAGRMTVLLDGGVRRGADVAKAVALGARAVLVGRPYLYGLAAGGAAGVARAMEMLRSELDRTMALVGARSIADLDTGLVTIARGWNEPTRTP